MSPGILDDRICNPISWLKMNDFPCRYIDKNPWSCNTSSLEVLQNELIDLIEKNQHLDNFDGGKIKCFGPPEMKGKKPLYYRNSKNKKLYS